MPGEQRFTRLVLGLNSAPSGHSVSFSVELAELLGLNLLGLFLADDSLRHLARFPFARELRLMGGGWQPLEPERVSGELDLAARSAARIFAEAVKARAPHSRFEVAHGPLQQALASASTAADIIVLIEPRSPAERATGQFRWLFEAALSSAAAVMLLPPQPARRTGPIVAIAVTADDESVAVAASLAVAAREPLVVVEAAGPGLKYPALRMATEAGIAVQRLPVPGSPNADVTAILDAMAGLQERLVVMSRLPADGEAAAAIAGRRATPVLLIEPAGAGAAE
jgi:hypothetical protein